MLASNHSGKRGQWILTVIPVRMTSYFILLAVSGSNLTLTHSLCRINWLFTSTRMEFDYLHHRSCWEVLKIMNMSLQWRHNERDGVLNHQPHDCLLNIYSGADKKKTSKLRVTCLCVGNSPVTDEFPAQRVSNAENVSIWWRHHGKYQSFLKTIQHLKVKLVDVKTLPETMLTYC